MLRNLIALFVLVAGIQASPDQIVQVCPRMICPVPEGPVSFPETEEELQNICKPATFWLECRLRIENLCIPSNPEEIQFGNRILQAVNEICSEDTLLHAAIVDNLKCFKTLTEESEPCPNYVNLPDHVEFADILVEEGLVTINDENDNYTMYRCTDFLNIFACTSLNVEKGCGTVAMDAFIDVMTRLGPAVVDGCEDFYKFLPAMIQVHRIETEKVENIADSMKKRK